MQLLRGSQSIDVLKNGSIVTIGNFDGVHLGHQSLLSLLTKEAKALCLPVVVILFEPQPNEFFCKEKPPARLTTLREKCDVLKALGVDYVYCLHFNNKVSHLTPEAFAQHILFSVLHARSIFIGPDFRFGYERRGDLSLLRIIAALNQAQVHVCTDYCLHEVRISSTHIRTLLMAGKLEAASSYLGRPYSISGRVVRGDGLGRHWGIPTANIHLKRMLPAITGVFLVRVIHKKNEMLYGVANLGRRPTVNGLKTVLEVHLFDFNGSLYHERLNVVFLKKMRDELTFPSVDALILQIKKDISQARAMLADLTV